MSEVCGGAGECPSVLMAGLPQHWLGCRNTDLGAEADMLNLNDTLVGLCCVTERLTHDGPGLQHGLLRLEHLGVVRRRQPVRAHR
jgi:hypothetical protein